MADYMDKKLWEKWANENFKEFSDIKKGSKIAIMLPNTDDLIVLRKNDSDFSVRKANRYDFEFPFAEIGFKFEENAPEQVLRANNFNIFVQLVGKEEIGLLCFVPEDQLNSKGYKNFLKRIGYNIGSSCCCCC